MGSKILVVDDEPDVAKGWARTLRLAGHDVVSARDSAVALELSRTHPLDLVIIDYMMPSMSGVELLNEIRKDHPHVRSIIVSGKLDSNVVEMDIRSQILTNIAVDLYLHKPVQNSRLKEEVVTLLVTTPGKGKDWTSMAKTKLEAATTKKSVRATEKALNRKKARKK